MKAYGSMEGGESVSLPVGPSLPGWTFVASMADANPFGRSFRLIGAILVAGLSLAILLAGALILRRAHQDAREAQRRTTFVANVSHELKTPLTSIRLFAEMLEEGKCVDQAKRSHYLRIIGEETRRLTRLVNNVLDFSRLERRKREFHTEVTDLAAAVSATVERERTRLADEGLEIELTLPDVPPTVPVDRDALEQILLNLLDNAVKYATDGKRVTVEFGVKSGPFVAVSDFGPGIPPEHRRKVFRAFHRVDDRLTAGHSGCGLGLGIAARLAEGMGAWLSLEQNHPSGCRFVLAWEHKRGHSGG